MGDLNLDTLRQKDAKYKGGKMLKNLCEELRTRDWAQLVRLAMHKTNREGAVTESPHFDKHRTEGSKDRPGGAGNIRPLTSMGGEVNKTAGGESEENRKEVNGELSTEELGARAMEVLMTIGKI